MKTGDTKCFGCNQGYLNCYQTCPNSPSHNNDISLTPTQTSVLGECDNGHRRKMHIKAEAAREIFEEIEENISENLNRNYADRYFNLIVKIAELKKKYTEGEK